MTGPRAGQRAGPLVRERLSVDPIGAVFAPGVLVVRTGTHFAAGIQTSWPSIQPGKRAYSLSNTLTICRHLTASQRKWQGSPYCSPLRINSITCGCIWNSCGRRYARHKLSSNPELFASNERNSTRLKRTALHFKRSEGGVKPMFPIRPSAAVLMLASDFLQAADAIHLSSLWESSPRWRETPR